MFVQRMDNGNEYECWWTIGADCGSQALGKFTEACSKYSYSFDYATLPIINKKQPI